MALIFVDVEGWGPAPGLNDDFKFEWGAVEFRTRRTFHCQGATSLNFLEFKEWLKEFKGRPIFVSDNPAYDWQFINYYFHRFGEEHEKGWAQNCSCNPFGHSARRIGDFYAGLRGDFYTSQDWKKLRVTDHDHNPVNDAMGNVEAFQRLLEGER